MIWAMLASVLVLGVIAYAVIKDKSRWDCGFSTDKSGRVISWMPSSIPVTVFCDPMSGTRIAHETMNAVATVNEMIGLPVLFFEDYTDEMDLSGGKVFGAIYVTSGDPPPGKAGYAHVRFREDGTIVESVIVIGEHNTKKTEVILCHELFHSLGLIQHDTNPRSIMHPKPYGRVGLTDKDRDQLRELYA